MSKRILSIILALAIFALSIPAMLVSAADDGIVYDMEAEEIEGSTVGLQIPGKYYIALKGSGKAWALFGNGVEMDAGRYQVIYYAYSVDENPMNAGAFTVDLYSESKATGQYIGYSLGSINPSDLTNRTEFTAVQFSVTLTEDSKNVSPRAYFEDNASVIIDRVVVVKEGTQPPAPRAYEGGGQSVRPDDEPVHAEYVVPMQEDTFLMNNETCGRFVNGSLEFRKTLHTVGGIQGLANPIYLEDGGKTARFYLRMPTVAQGEYLYLTIILLEAGMPIMYKTFKGNDFVEYRNQSYVVEHTFTADSNKPIDIMIEWNGNIDAVIDRIVFSDQPGDDRQEVIVEAEQNEDGYYCEFTTDVMETMTAIDSYVIRTDNKEIIMPVAYLQEWFNEGYTSVRLDLTDRADDQVSQQLRSRVEHYDADITELALFDLEITLSTDTQQTQVQNLSNSLKVRTVLNNLIISGFSDGRKLPIVYQNTAEDGVTMLTSTLDPAQRYVEFSLTHLGTVISTVADIG